jgi:integrase
MSVRERQGKWHHRFEYQGKEYSGSTGLDATPQNKKAAQKIETELFTVLEQGRRPNSRVEIISFMKALEIFLPAAEAKYRAHPNSFKRIKTSLASALVYFGKTPVSLIDAAKIDDYKTWRATTHEVRDITIRHDLHALSTFFAYAIRHHWAHMNPIDEVDIPSDAEAERIHVLTPEEEVEYFKRAIRFPNLHDVGRLMINQGMRPEEVTCLAKADIDLDRGEIHIRRGKSRAAKRVLAMTRESREILEPRMKGDSAWIFPSRRNRGSHIGRINPAHDSIVAEAAKQGTQITLVPYDFRHTFATRAAQSRVDLATLAALLGHGSIRCVQKYLHTTDEHKKSAMKRYDRSMRRKGRSDHSTS